MHNKTIVSAIGWLLSIGGWFLWNILLSAIYKDTITYAVKDSFLHYFGRNFLWWFTLIITLAALIIYELGVSSIKKAFWPTDTDIFQELQKDKIIRQRFEEAANSHEDELVGINNTEMALEEQMRREGEIQDLLDHRPMLDKAYPPAREASVSSRAAGKATTKKESEEAKVVKADAKNAIERRPGSLHRRRISSDTYPAHRSEIPMARHSVDVADLERN